MKGYFVDRERNNDYVSLAALTKNDTKKPTVMNDNEPFSGGLSRQPPK